jgi:hypothetical protein
LAIHAVFRKLATSPNLTTANRRALLGRPPHPTLSLPLRIGPTRKTKERKKKKKRMSLDISAAGPAVPIRSWIGFRTARGAIDDGKFTPLSELYRVPHNCNHTPPPPPPPPPPAAAPTPPVGVFICSCARVIERERERERKKERAD